MKSSFIKAVSVAFIIFSGLSVYAKHNSNNQPKIDKNLTAKLNVMQGYWKSSKCINEESDDFPVKFKVKSFQIYLKNTKRNLNSYKSTGKAQFFKNKNCVGKSVIYHNKKADIIHKNELDDIKIINKNRFQDVHYNDSITFTRITKTKYDKLK